MSENIQGQRVISPEAAGVVAVSDVINCVVGVTPTLLVFPLPQFAPKPTFIVLASDQGGFRVRVGDFHVAGMPATEFPTTSSIAGTSGLYVPPGQSIVLPFVEKITVAGYNVASALTYYAV